MTPMPPACAMAIAISASVTVSMAEATIGMLSGISRVMRLRMSTSDGQHFGQPGPDQHVVEGQRLAQGSVGYRGHRQLQPPRLCGLKSGPSAAGMKVRPARNRRGFTRESTARFGLAEVVSDGQRREFVDRDAVRNAQPHGYARRI